MANARDNRKATAVGLAVALCFAALGSVRAQNSLAEDIVTTGHTTWSSISTEYDNCFAGIAGALMTRVTWFNGMTLFSRTASGGDEWIYAMELFDDKEDNVEDDDPDGYDDQTGIQLFDPTETTMYETGKVYDFPDENEPDVRWNVVEYFALVGTNGGPGMHGLPEPLPPDVTPPSEQERVYVWAVQVGDHAITDLTIGRDYNFVTVADTCKFNVRPIGDVTHDNGADCQGRDQDQPACQHNPEDVPEGQQGPTTHDHGTFPVGLWVGGKPKSIPVGADPGELEPPDPGGAEP